MENETLAEDTLTDERSRLEYIGSLALTVFLDPTNPTESVKSTVLRAMQKAEDHLDIVDAAIERRFAAFEKGLEEDE